MKELAARAPDAVSTDVDDVEPEQSRQGVLFRINADVAGVVGTADAPAAVVLLDRPVLEIGREANASRGVQALALSNTKVSARHARIEQTDGGFLLSDLGSTNGTLRNGLLITTPQHLADGDVLFLGGEVLVFRLVSRHLWADLMAEAGDPFVPVPTRSPTLAAVLRRLRRLVATDAAILLSGETGVGKEVLAEAVHQRSGRMGPFVAVNCAALPGELVESELFGYVRGAHSQAGASKSGLVEKAQGGSLFLDEIGDMPPAAQAKLLRFLQTREILPLGATQEKKVDVRIICATSRLEGREGSPGLREDLRGRFGAAPFEIVPLRERREDLGGLIAHFWRRQHTGAIRGFDSPAMLALSLYGWPRNVRELEAVMREAWLSSEGEASVGLRHLPAHFSALVVRQGGRSVAASGGTAPVPVPVAGTPTAHAVAPDGLAGASGNGRGIAADASASTNTRRRSPRALPTREQLEALLTAHAGNVAEVARTLDRNWKVVHRALNRHGIDAARFRG